ncbi:MAG: hypothetical protein OXF93_17395 [Acidobacteria bacterium]|nr:hypothetical protein [Acidobacteriota bacterium]
MTPLDLITRRQYLEEELALAAATHQYVLDGPTPTMPADRDARDALLDRLRARWTNTLDCLTRYTDPARGGDPQWQGPVKERARHAAERFAGPADVGTARPTAAGTPETALRAAVEQAERALFDDEGCYSVSKTHDAALDLTEAARALLSELETRHTK